MFLLDFAVQLYSVCFYMFCGCLNEQINDDDNYTVSQKNDNDVLRYNFNAHQPILIIIGRDIAE